jgi:hypothetical protein
MARLGTPMVSACTHPLAGFRLSKIRSEPWLAGWGWVAARIRGRSAGAFSQWGSSRASTSPLPVMISIQRIPAACEDSTSWITAWCARAAVWPCRSSRRVARIFPAAKLRQLALSRPAGAAPGASRGRPADGFPGGGALGAAVGALAGAAAGTAGAGGGGGDNLGRVFPGSSETVSA